MKRKGFFRYLETAKPLKGIRPSEPYDGISYTYEFRNEELYRRVVDANRDAVFIALAGGRVS